LWHCFEASYRLLSVVRIWEVYLHLLFEDFKCEQHESQPYSWGVA